MQDYLEKLYNEVLISLGKPLKHTSSERLLFSCPVCKKPKLYVIRYTSYCHRCGKSYSISDLAKILDITLLSQNYIKNYSNETTYSTNNIINYVDSPEVLDFFYKSIKTALPTIPKDSELLKEFPNDRPILDHSVRYYNRPLTADDFVLKNFIPYKSYLQNKSIPGIILKRDQITNLMYPSLFFPYPSLLFFYETWSFGAYAVSQISAINARLINPKDDSRYIWAAGAKKRIFVPAKVTKENVQAITEGEKKALFLTSIGIPTVGVSGVNCFKTPEFENFHVSGREIFIIYDPPNGNQNVINAREALINYLRERNWRPLPIDLPLKVDDYIKQFGAIKLKTILARTKIETWNGT